MSELYDSIGNVKIPLFYQIMNIHVLCLEITVFFDLEDVFKNILDILFMNSTSQIGQDPFYIS